MSTTLSIPVRTPTWEAPDFLIVRRVVNRLRRMSETSNGEPCQNRMVSRSLATMIEQCDQRLGDLIKIQTQSLRSVDVDSTLEKMADLDLMLEYSFDEQTFQSRASQVQTICASLRILSGSFRTAAEELECILREIQNQCEREAFGVRAMPMVCELEKIVDAWQEFAESAISLDAMMVTAPGIRLLLEKQRVYLECLGNAHRKAGG